MQKSVVKIFIFGLLTFHVSLFTFHPSVSASEAVSSLEKTPLPKINIPPVTRRTMDNGMKLLLLKDDELPVVRGFLYVRTGSIHEPADKVGLAELLGAMLRAGGTLKTPAAQFDQALASMGAEISAEVGREYGLISFKSLKDDLPQVLKLVFEMLREPAFDPKKIEVKKIQMLEGLRRENDNPAEIAMREFPKRIYGPDNIWARSPTPESIQAISRDDLLSFHQKFFYPERMILAISGDFSESEVLAELARVTGGWPKAPADLQKVAELETHWSSELFLIPKSADQATLVLGHYGDKRTNPDKYALLLLNEILGGDALTSRLGKKIRSSLGLVYGIYTRYGLQTDYGTFFILAQTKAASAQKVLEEVRAQLEQIRKVGDLTEAEMDFYKDSLLNSLYAQYEPKFNFAKDEARFDYFNYPPNYLELFRRKIQEVTLEDLRRVAQKYLRPEALKILLVGDPKKIGPLPGARLLPL